MALQAERHDHLAEWRVGAFQLLVHLRRQAAGQIPVVCFGQNMFAANQLHMPIRDRLCGIHSEACAKLGGKRLFDVPHTACNDARRLGQAMFRAPVFERKRGAVMAEQFRVECLQQGQQLDAAQVVGARRRRNASGERCAAQRSQAQACSAK